MLRTFETRHNLSFHRGNFISEHAQRRPHRTVPKAHWGKTIINEVVSFYLGFGLSGGKQVEQGDRGERARENRGQERDLSERGSEKRNLKKKKHSFFVYNRLSSSFKTNSYLTSTDALKILLWTRKCRFILRLLKQHSLWSNWIPIEFGFPIGHEWSDINYVHICQCLANCSRQNSSVHKASRVTWLWNLYSVSESYNWIKSRILIGQRSEVFSVELLCVNLKTGVEETEWTQLLFIENTLLPTSLYWWLSFCLVFASSWLLSPLSNSHISWASIFHDSIKHW